MSKKIDERIPREVGKGALPDHPAIKTPWEKLISYHDAAHFCSRYGATVAASMMQVYRILVPDYEKRCEAICKNAYARLYPLFSGPYGPVIGIDKHNAHPFCRGNFTGSLNGDSGDDRYLMCGRVTDFGTYRVEKELDVCDWDIVGSELCRATTQSLQGVADGYAVHMKEGPRVEFHMVEARGCGDRHCRIVAESREKFPMPEHKQWECFGPIATSDQIKDTAEEYTVKESMIFREETNYKFCNGTCMEEDPNTALAGCASATGTDYLIPVLEELIKDGTLDEKFVDHVIRCVFEAAGKTAFGDFYTKDAVRSWLGAPADVNDGRLMGAYLETVMQCLTVPYEIEAFNKEEVIYLVDRAKLQRRMPRLVTAYLALWGGEVRTLAGAQWFLWEEPGDAGDDKVRIVIKKKIDKYC
ncbi:hypothetical protein [Qiania dongpingensis]|uniref:Uncharacterized protein n=1 Tax=Qiania dongpingensis TaxID=2763669 RepID=A0A7G9G7K1_9FIRM|nr:hypothetical protein [Qiania dongpingensis]QNM06783.1 hypothetical protein H9Q78_06625 [Qiania dongpingensis]